VHATRGTHHIASALREELSIFVMGMEDKEKNKVLDAPSADISVDHFLCVSVRSKVNSPNRKSLLPC
jgi:hypothetical protein